MLRREQMRLAGHANGERTMTTSTQEKEYRIAFVIRDGDWDVAETFTAANDDAANEYAEENYSDNEWWFVLDASGKNINGGEYGGE